MSLLTNPLFPVISLLVGFIVGALVGRASRNHEWKERERLMRETFLSQKTECWVKAQVDAGTPPQV